MKQESTICHDVTFLSECPGMLHSRTEARWGLEMINLAEKLRQQRSQVGARLLPVERKLERVAGKWVAGKVVAILYFIVCITVCRGWLGVCVM